MEKKSDKKELLSMYESLFEQIWKRASSLVGELTLELVIKVSMKRLLPVFSFLEDISVSLSGIHLDKLKKNIDKRDEFSYPELRRGFQALLSEILTFFSVLWGNGITKGFYNKLKEFNIKKVINFPSIIILSNDDNGLGTFLENMGFYVARIYDADTLRNRILNENIAVILIEDGGHFSVSLLNDFIIDVSADTSILIFGKDRKKSKLAQKYEYIEWPSKDRDTIFQIIKNTVLEYVIFKMKRLPIKEDLSSGVDILRDEKSLNNNILAVFRSFIIELSDFNNYKKAVSIVAKYIEKIFNPFSFCLILKVNNHFEVFVFDKNCHEKKLLKKDIIILFILNRILMQRDIKKQKIICFYLNEKESNIELEIRPDELSDLIQKDARSCIIFPLIAREGNLGCMAIHSRKGIEFDINDIKKVSFMAYQLSNILSIIKVISRIKDISIKDPLTGLYNRRYFDEILQHEYLRAKRYYFPLSFIMIDIDYFKSVNDTFGHLIGDKVLKKLAKLIKDSVRQVDIVSRFGGEEFAIILLNTPVEEAANMAERLRSIVQKHEFMINGYRINITISAGISTLKKSTISKDVLIEQADTALLKAKANGRNKVYMYISENEIKEVKPEGLRERRRYKRVEAELLINYTPLTAQYNIDYGEAISKDISEGGIAFKDIRNIPKGEFLLLDFDIPVSDDQKHHIKTLAQVVWSKKEGENVIIGTKLILLNPEDKSVLRSLSAYDEKNMYIDK